MVRSNTAYSFYDPREDATAGTLQPVKTRFLDRNNFQKLLSAVETSLGTLLDMDDTEQRVLAESIYDMSDDVRRQEAALVNVLRRDPAQWETEVTYLVSVLGGRWQAAVKERALAHADLSVRERFQQDLAAFMGEPGAFQAVFQPANGPSIYSRNRTRPEFSSDRSIEYPPPML